jgi:hypothetical protein
MNGFQLKILKRKIEHNKKGLCLLSEYDKNFIEDLIQLHEEDNNFELTSKQNSYLNRIGGRK